MKECHFEALLYASAGMLLWFYALYKSQMLSGISRNQLFALLVTQGGAIVYWYYLMLLTMDKVEIGPIQFVGLVFAMLNLILVMASLCVHYSRTHWLGREPRQIDRR